jgi:hypothetical protein
MRAHLRQALSWVALAAIGLRVVLLGVAPPAMAAPPAAFDPYAITCLGTAHSAQPDSSVPGDLVPGHTCAQCALCNVVSSPLAPSAAVIGLVAPRRIASVFWPASATPPADFISKISLARGPPQSA